MAVNVGAAGLVDVSLLALILAVLFATVWILRDSKGSKERQEEEMRLIYNSVLATGTLAWPIVFDATIGLNKLYTDPRLLLGFFWPMALNITELNYVSQFSSATGAKGRASAMFLQQDLNSDTASIMSAAFAMGSLMMNRNNTYNTSHIIMYAMVFCLAFVVPTLQVPPETKEAVMFRSAQKIITTYAIGFIVCGISSDLFANFFQSAPASSTTTFTATTTPPAPSPATTTPTSPPPSPAPQGDLQGGAVSSRAQLVFRDLPSAVSVYE